MPKGESRKNDGDLSKHEKKYEGLSIEEIKKIMKENDDQLKILFTAHEYYRERVGIGFLSRLRLLLIYTMTMLSFGPSANLKAVRILYRYFFIRRSLKKLRKIEHSFLGKITRSIAVSRLLPGIGIFVLSALYILKDEAHLIIFGTGISISILMFLDAAAVWLRYKSSTYGDNLLEVGEVAQIVSQSLRRGGDGGSHGRQLPLFPSELEHGDKSLQSNEVPSAKGARA